MKTTILLLAVSCLLCTPGKVKAQERNEVTWQKVEGVTIPVPPQVHPRLYLRAADIPELQQRMKHPEIKETLKLMKRLGKDRTKKEEAKAPAKDGFRYYAEMRG